MNSSRLFVGWFHRLNLLLIMLVLTLYATADDDSGPLLTDRQMETVRRGDIYVETLNTDESGGVVRGAIKINATADDIFNAIIECDKAAEFHKQMKRCTTIEKKADYGLYRHEIKYLWFIPKQVYTFRGDYTGVTKVRFHVVSGDLKQLDGGWDIFPMDHPDQYAVRYYATIKPGFPVPRWMVRRSLRKDIPKMLEIVKFMAENPELLSTAEADNSAD